MMALATRKGITATTSARLDMVRVTGGILPRASRCLNECAIRVADAVALRLELIQNWLEELKAKVPTGRQAPALFLPIVVSTASSS